MPVVLCPCSLSSALVEDLHLILAVNALLFVALLALLRTADTSTAQNCTDKPGSSAHTVYYPLLQ